MNFKDENKAEHFKKIKETEKEILLQNISCLPDKVSQPSGNERRSSSQEEADNENQEFINAANMAFSSPNPNFIVLDRELLENFNSENELVRSSSQQQVEKTTPAVEEEPENKGAKEEQNAEGKSGDESSKDSSAPPSKTADETVKDGESEA